MNMSSASLAFNKLRVYCVEFIQRRDLKSLKNLYKNLQGVEKDSLDEISPYVLFPFQVILKKPKLCSEELITESLECVAYVFSHATIKDRNVLSEFLACVCGLISTKNGKEMSAEGSEERRKAASSVFLALFDHASLYIWKSLYDHSTVPILGHIVLLLLSIASANIEREARLTALRALRSLCKPSYLMMLEKSEQQLIHASIADCMACFLPGVSTSLMKIISDPSTGQKVRSESMDVLAIFILMILGDTTPVQNEDVFENIKNPKLGSLFVKRDEKWMEGVVEKLGQVFEIVCSSSNSDEWSVRLSSVKFCGRILLKCKKNMKRHASILLNIPVKLLHDDYDQVRNACSNILDEFSSTIQENDSGSQALTEILEENLFILSTRLPGLMRTSQDSEKLATLKVLLGYLSLLKEKIQNVLYSQPHFSKLANMLLHCYELDSSVIQLLDVSPSGLPEGESAISCFRKQFKHYRDEKISSVLSQICNTLGRYGDIEILSDYFLDIYNSSETNCKQAVIVLIEILTGAGSKIEIPGVVDNELDAVIRNLLDEFLSPENWYLVTNYDSEYFRTHHLARLRKLNQHNENLALVSTSAQSSFKEASAKHLKSNILLCCLHLDAVLNFSNILGENFCSLLMYALYPVLEKTTDRDASLSTCAVRALSGIACNCGYNSVPELIAKNADYLISDISIQIHKLDTFPRCPAVLQAMLDHSDCDVLPLVYDTVDEIVEALDLYHLDPQKLLIFIPVLLSVVNAVSRWMADVTSNPEVNHEGAKSADTIKSDNNGNESGHDKQPRIKDGGQHNSFVDNLKAKLLELHKNKKISSLEEEVEVNPDWDPGQEENEEPENETENDEQKKPPMEVQVTTQVLTRCIHLMAHSDARVRMRIMEVVESGMTVLSKFENELLPMAHKLWSPLLAKFGDAELQVVIKAFDTLCIIAKYAKDFLRKRFCKEILPKILSLLESQASKSKLMWWSKRSNKGAILMAEFSNKSQDVAFKHSIAFKHQQKALSGLGPLLKDLEVKRKDHILICKSTMQYLSSRQPAELQESAVTLFRYLIKIDSDLTWLELNRVWCHKAILEPCNSSDYRCHENLKTIYFGGSTDPNHEFSSNVEKLLKEC